MPLPTGSVTVGDTMALTLSKLGELVGSVRTLLNDLSSEQIPRQALISKCESRLGELHLRPGQIANGYLVPFAAQIPRNKQ